MLIVICTRRKIKVEWHSEGLGEFKAERLCHCLDLFDQCTQKIIAEWHSTGLSEFKAQQLHH
jgi:hypothetical protein